MSAKIHPRDKRPRPRSKWWGWIAGVAEVIWHLNFLFPSP
jgi:hypothetical protein